MREIKADLWDWHNRAVIVITTGGQVDRRGAAVMLRGCARQARDRFPDLALHLGALLKAAGNVVHELGGGVVSFPVENSPFEVPDVRLIERSCRQLRDLTDRRCWPLVVLPRPGCGAGGLSWKEVQPVLTRHLDDRFVVVWQPNKHGS